MTTYATPGSSRIARRPRRGRHRIAPWLFLAPFLAVFLTYTAVPAAAAIALSFTDLQGRDLRTPFAVDFVGFANYVRLLTSGNFLQSLGNTSLYVAIGAPLTMALGFVVALALHSRIRRFRGLLRGVFYAPVVANVVAVALIWEYAFNSEGTVNEMLRAVGIAGPNWLGDPGTAMPVVLLLGVWRNFGTAMLLFLAGLQAVPEDVHEAASLDGAGSWQRLWHITLPLLMPTILLVSVFMTVLYLNVFDEPYLLTEGGPLGTTASVALFTYQQFGFGQFGTSSAASLMLLLLVGAISFVQFRVLRPRS